MYVLSLYFFLLITPPYDLPEEDHIWSEEGPYETRAMCEVFRDRAEGPYSATSECYARP